MVHNQFLLMKDRRFLPLFITQFLGAFHDNLFKNAFIVLILYRIAVDTEMSEQTQSLLITLAAGTLILPFFLFSAMGGQLADKLPKDKMIHVIKMAEIGIAALGTFSLWTGFLPFCFITLFLLGAQSAFFSPCKYSILPEKINQDELIGGNALLNTGTFLAILLGMIAGALLMSLDHGILFVGGLMIVISVAGYIASRFIPKGIAANPSLVFNPNPFSETWIVLRHVFSQKNDVILSLLGKGWFFCIGSLFMSQFPNYVKGTLGAEETVFTLFIVLFSIGIGVGGLLNNRLLKGKINASLVPFAALGLTFFSIDIYVSSAYIFRLPEGELMGLSEFIIHLAHWRIILDVVMIAVFGGLFVVPLSAILQDRTDQKTRAQIMAGSAITDSLFMVAAAVLASFLIAAEWEIRELFLFFALINMGVTVFTFSLPYLEKKF